MRADMQVQRLGAKSAHPSSLEARAGAFLHEARPLAGISEAQIDLIQTSLVHRARARGGVRLVPVLVAVAVLLVAGSVMALVGGWRPRLPFFAPAPTSQDSPPSHSPQAKAASAAPSNSAAPPSAEMLAPKQRPQPATRRLFRAGSPAAARAPLTEAVPVESALSAEARSLADALARWRRDGQAEAALALLVAHERHFPRGELSVESRVARAEILLALDRRDQALAVFDSLTLADLPRARELETLRGELRAHVGRCREARADLSRVVAGGGADDLSRRAARALQTCP
jgi:hypothetical protein